MKKILIVLMLFCLTSYVEANNVQKVNKLPDNIKSFKALIPIYSQKIGFQLPSSWKPVFQKKRENFFIMEFMPKDEKINSWKNMFTIQAFQNLASKATPKQFLLNMSDKFQKICGTNTIFDSIGESSIDGYNAYSVIMGCTKIPSNQTNQNLSEIGYYMVIQGDKDLYVIYKASRGASFNPDESPLTKSNAEEFIADFIPFELCKKNSPKGECIRNSYTQ